MAWVSSAFNPSPSDDYVVQNPLALSGCPPFHFKIHINGEFCQYLIRIQIALKKLAETGVFLKVAVYNVSVFIAAEFLQDEHFPALPGTLQKAGAVYRKKTRGKLASATLYR